MSIFNDKSIKSVADIAAKIMAEKLHPNQQKLDVHEPEKDKLTAKDFEMLRKGKKASDVKKEEVGHIDEALQVKKEFDDENESEHGVYSGKKKIGYVVHNKKSNTHTAYHGHKYGKDDYEESDDFSSHEHAVNQVKKSAGLKEGWDDMMKSVAERGKPQPSGGAGKKEGTRYGGAKQKDEKKPVKESFTEMLQKYEEQGLKAFVVEEPDNEQFTKELDDQKASMEGKKKQPNVAAAATQGVKQMPEEIEVLDADKINGTTVETIDERKMTEPEMKKKEEIVKSMKKGLAGFKQRYGDRAKEVMYATATKQAMKD